MPKRILIIQAHPDASRPHLAHSLAAAYANGAEGAGHSVRQVVLATLGFPLLRSQQEWEEGSVPIGLTGDMKPEDVAKWMAELERLGAQAL
jgi:putative NADPH-quinone reductase